MKILRKSRFGFQILKRQFSGSEISKEVCRFDPSLGVESAQTPPSSWFLRDDFYELDKVCRKNVIVALTWSMQNFQLTTFRKNWVCVGRKDQLAKEGQFFSGQLGSDPFLVVKDESSILRAFHNVCRHHAAQVAPNCTEGCTQRWDRKTNWWHSAHVTFDF